MVAAALIGAGASLLGGLFGKNKKSDPKVETRRAIQGQAWGARVASKEYGFNPLTLLGVSQPMAGQQEANYMGAAVSDAGMILADALTRQKDVGRLERAERMNEHLRKQVTDLTLRPAVPGVYGPGNGVGGGDGRPGQDDGSGETGEGRPFDRDGHSPFGGVSDYGTDDLVTGPQASVKKDVPAFRLFGRDFYGSGLFSTGQQVEDSIGEGPLQWAVSPVLAADALANGFYQMGGEYSSRKWKDKLIEGYEADEKAKKPVLSDWFTDPLTGFTAKRYKP